MWQLSPTQWINPANILYVKDDPHADEIRVWLTSDGADPCTYRGEERRHLVVQLQESVGSALSR